MARMLALLAALALAGCTVPSTSTVTIPTYSPVREALAYFPAGSVAVAVVETDPQDPGLRRTANAAVLAPLRRALEQRGMSFDDVRPILGNPAVVGLPYPGGAPLAVLATHDPGALAQLAGERVAAGAARPAGRYRGADLYDEVGFSFAVRDRVLLMSRTARDLLDALDRRVRPGGFEAIQLNDVMPDPGPPATFVRAYVDLSLLMAQQGATARAIAPLRALTTAGVSVGADPERLRGVATAEIAGQGLTESDLPALAPVRGQRPPLPAGARALAVSDLAPLAQAAERALRDALPVSALRIDALRTRLRAANVELVPELLAGPAVLAEGPVLRLQPAHPALLAEALERAAQRLRLRRAGSLYRFRGVTLGFVRGAFVAGRVPAGRLTRLADRPLVALTSPLVARLPRLADWYPRPVEVSVAGSPERLTLQASSAF
jgi:hypothetical protein